MTKKIYICDKCQKEVPYLYYMKYELVGSSTLKYKEKTLCFDCMEKLSIIISKYLNDIYEKYK